MEINKNNADRFNQTGTFGAGAIRRPLTKQDTPAEDIDCFDKLAEMDQGHQDLNPLPGAVQYRNDATKSTFDESFTKKDGVVQQGHIEVKFDGQGTQIMQDLQKNKNGFDFVNQDANVIKGIHVDNNDPSKSYEETWNVANAPTTKP